MNIIMAGVDYHSASLESREKVGFSLGETAWKDNSKEISAMKNLIDEHIKNFSKWCAHRKKLMA